MADFIILAVLAAAVFFILRGQIRRRRRGQSAGACSGCGGCLGCGAGCGTHISGEKTE